MKPLNQFLSTEFGQVHVTKKAFHKSHAKVTQLVEKLCQVRFVGRVYLCMWSTIAWLGRVFVQDKHTFLLYIKSASEWYGVLLFVLCLYCMWLFVTIIYCLLHNYFPNVGEEARYRSTEWGNTLYTYVLCLSTTFCPEDFMFIVCASWPKGFAMRAHVCVCVCV